MTFGLIVRIIILLFIIRFIVAIVRNVTRRVNDPRRRPDALREGGALVRDPQCGTYVPERQSVTAVVGSERVSFCSAACRDAWLAAHTGAHPGQPAGASHSGRA
jgi:hypothetical protein